MRKQQVHILFFKFHSPIIGSDTNYPYQRKIKRRGEPLPRISNLRAATENFWTIKLVAFECNLQTAAPQKQLPEN